MSGMLDLANVLELIIHRFNQRPFPQQNFVHQLNEPLFHVFLGFGDELQSACVEFFKQLLTDVPPRLQRGDRTNLGSSQGQVDGHRYW